jgi:hypothetical protein
VTRGLLALLVAALLGGGLPACGGAGESTRSASRASSSPRARSSSSTSGGAAGHASSVAAAENAAKLDADGDNDNGGGGRYDSDDNEFLRLGHAAGTGDARAIAALVERYYAAGAGADGALACRLIYSVIAESIVEEYGSSDLRGSTCAVVVSKLLARHRGELAAKLAALHVISMRVEGDQGFVMMSFGREGEGYLLLQREHGVWKVRIPLDVRLP